MKNLLIALFVAISTCLIAQAQVYLGLSAGPSFTKFKSPNAYHTTFKNLIGLTVDIPVSITLNKHLAIQSGLSLIHMGCEENPDQRLNVIDLSDPDYIIFLHYTGTYAFNYLSMPLTLNYSLPFKENKYSVYGRVGGYGSYMINGSFTPAKNGYNTPNKKEAINNDQNKISKYDFGLLFALGITKKIGKGNLLIEGKYMLGCNNVNTNKNGDSYPSDYSQVPYLGSQKIFNRGLFLNLGYMFCLGKTK